MAILEPTLRVGGRLIVLAFLVSVFWMSFAQVKLGRYLAEHHPGPFHQVYRDRLFRKFFLWPFLRGG